MNNADTFLLWDRNLPANLRTRLSVAQYAMQLAGLASIDSYIGTLSQLYVSDNTKHPMSYGISNSTSGGPKFKSESLPPERAFWKNLIMRCYNYNIPLDQDNITLAFLSTYTHPFTHRSCSGPCVTVKLEPWCLLKAKVSSFLMR